MSDGADFMAMPCGVPPIRYERAFVLKFAGVDLGEGTCCLFDQVEVIAVGGARGSASQRPAAEVTGTSIALFSGERIEEGDLAVGLRADHDIVLGDGNP